MNIYVVFGIVGIISSILAAMADVPLVKPGKPDPSEKAAVNGVNPWWADVTAKRFNVSFWLSFLGQPGGYVVLWLLADLIANENEALALALRINNIYRMLCRPCMPYYLLYKAAFVPEALQENVR